MKTSVFPIRWVLAEKLNELCDDATMTRCPKLCNGVCLGSVHIDDEILSSDRMLKGNPNPGTLNYKP